MGNVSLCYRPVDDNDAMIIIADLTATPKFQSVVALTALFDAYAHSPPILVVNVNPGYHMRTARMHQFMIESTTKLLQIG